MPNHRSAIKRQAQNAKRNARNTGWRSRMRRALKRARTAIDAGAEDKEQLVKEAVSIVNRACSKNVIHSGTARRYVSRLAKAAQTTSPS